MYRGLLRSLGLQGEGEIGVYLGPVSGRAGLGLQGLLQGLEGTLVAQCHQRPALPAMQVDQLDGRPIHVVE